MELGSVHAILVKLVIQELHVKQVFVKQADSGLDTRKLVLHVLQVQLVIQVYVHAT